MKRISSSLAILLAALLLPVAAHADTFDDFTITGGGHTLTYTLPTSVTLSTSGAFTSFTQTAITDIDGAPVDFETSTYFDTAISNLVSMSITLPSTVYNIPTLELLGPAFVNFDIGSGTVTATFLQGSYSLQELDSGLNPLSPPVPFTLDISPDGVTTPPAITPEPSSLILLSTGALGILGFAQIRRRAAIL